MSQKEKDNDMDPEHVPQSEVFTKKEVFQHPQPADSGKPLDPGNSKKSPAGANIKEENKTNKEEGLNEENSTGDAGAFEGLEDQGK